MIKNYLEDLCFDLQELIYFKLHKMYMNDLKDEIYEESLEFEWRKENNLGHDLDEDYEMSSVSSSDSYYSFTESD